MLLMRGLCLLLVLLLLLHCLGLRPHHGLRRACLNVPTGRDAHIRRRANQHGQILLGLQQALVRLLQHLRGQLLLQLLCCLRRTEPSGITHMRRRVSEQSDSHSLKLVHPSGVSFPFLHKFATQEHSRTLSQHKKNKKNKAVVISSPDRLQQTTTALHSLNYERLRPLETPADHLHGAVQ